MTTALAIYAAVVTVWAISETLSRLRWRRAYHRALALFGTLPQPVGKTPHQKAAETRVRQRVEAMRKHRLALEASMRAAAE